MFNETYYSGACKDCGKLFEISYGEKEWYDSRGWKYPKRCRDCRDHKKMTKKGE